jgi:hypothetical protein
MVEITSIDQSAFPILRSLDLYLKEYTYNIEYFYEGYAIFLTDLLDNSHRVVIFYNINFNSYSIRSSYNDEQFLLVENIQSIEELNRIAIKTLFRCDAIERLLQNKQKTNEKKLLF